MFHDRVSTGTTRPIEEYIETLDALGLPAFASDRSGKVAAMTCAAKKLVEERIVLLLREHKIELLDPDARRSFVAALDRAASSTRIAQQRHAISICARTTETENDLIILDVVALPPSIAIKSATNVLVVARAGCAEDAHIIGILRTGFNLTQAEAEVALLMARAESFPAIARRRRVSEGTVRCQSKTIFAKVGVGSQARLVHKLRHLAG